MGSSASIARLILFDGVCNLCNGSVQFIIKHDPLKKFSFASLQSDTAQKILRNYTLDTPELYSIILFENGRIFDRSTAVLRIAKELSGWWPFFYLFIIVPPFIRHWVYKLIANNRYKMFGKADECWIPMPELRGRFLN